MTRDNDLIYVSFIVMYTLRINFVVVYMQTTSACIMR